MWAAEQSGNSSERSQAAGRQRNAADEAAVGRSCRCNSRGNSDRWIVMRMGRACADTERQVHEQRRWAAPPALLSSLRPARGAGCGGVVALGGFDGAAIDRSASPLLFSALAALLCSPLFSLCAQRSGGSAVRRRDSAAGRRGSQGRKATRETHTGEHRGCTGVDAGRGRTHAQPQRLRDENTRNRAGTGRCTTQH